MKFKAPLFIISAAVAFVSARYAYVPRRPRVEMAERLLAIGRDCAKHLSPASRNAHYDNWLYDENGLPK